ncbi:Transglutaminase-like superfamily protein [Roseimaritima multifibrata]|uniref:Transglutaminase-like superfamily protein n=1 Tax=Roseimaritima multifibrata TaxID=1930274 RepID=A0A517MLE3_9BACT|nr:transglutaminase family protein [Roseimaritima multifibrata]QDS95716.1 Transglutaminase-like superfamily protein [Roseimaritima multifibrata]
MTADPDDYLEACDIVNFRDPAVLRLSADLAGADVLATARRCFEFVRDEIRHSSDHKLNPVTCVASDVLLHRTGYCYAKSHLLCALLRANGIPAGMCYQRLTVDGDAPPHCLHGLNAIFLPDIGWHRVDARGNREDVLAEFCPPREQLAFASQHLGEFDLPEIYVNPLPNVVKCLNDFESWDQVLNNLPDVPVV